MRLIDADALISFLVKAGQFVKVQDDKRTAAHAIGKIIEHVEKMPTVDAIPVEWLRERKHLAAIDGDHWAENIIRYLLDAWQKEQEASE